MRPYVPGEDMTGVSVSAPDYMLLAGNRNPGGYIARNPKNHADQWYVSQAYFEENLEPADAPARDPAAELRAALEAVVQLLTKPKTNSIRDVGRVVGAIGIARAALAATEGEEA
jgi:hypothetical protein